MEYQCEKQCGECCKVMMIMMGGECDKDFAKWVNYRKRCSLVKDDDGTYYLKINTPCKHLTKDNKCAIYKDRPDVCKEYDCRNFSKLFKP